MSEPARLAPPAVTARAVSARRIGAAFAPRFFLALLVGLVWLGPAWWAPRLAYAMLAWDALLLAAWLVDWRRLPRPQEIEIERRWPAPASLGVESGVTLEIRCDRRCSFEATLHDDVPHSLSAELPHLELSVPPSGSARADYSLRPRERGDLRIGRVYLRYRTALQFAERWAVADLSQTIRVYPNLDEPRRHKLYLIRSRQIELEKRLRRQRGRGREFESLREFREGDEPRDICWTASARRSKLISKVYHTERSQAVLIVVDAGRLMLARIGSEAASPSKLDVAANAALTLAEVALYSGDRVGLVAYGRKTQARLAAGRGVAHRRAILDCLAQVRGELLEAEHAAAADHVLSIQQQRGLVIWLTDMAETAATPEVVEAASRLGFRHLVLFVAIAQPQLRLLVAGRPESPEDMYRYAAAQDLIQRREVLLRRMREHGALALELEPGRLSTGLVNQYLQVKERGLL